MRKLLLFTLLAAMLAVTAAAADGPIDKGSMIIGGTAGFQMLSGDLYENSAGDGQTSLIFMPAFGYFMSPGFLIGGELMFESDSQGDFSGSIFGIGPMVGCGGAGINYMLSNAVAIDFGLQVLSISEEPDGGDSISGMTITVGAGIQAFVF